MEIVYVKVNDLRPAEYNPRKWSKEAISQIKASIQEFGMIDPIIANKSSQRANIVIGGHLRLYACKELGHEEVPVVYVDIADETKERELNLRLNKNTGEWDWNLLANFDEETLKLAGFNSTELERIFDLNIQEDGFDGDKEYQEVEKTQIERGDMYKLGEHYLMCGDSSNRKDVEKLMQDQKASMIFTDPPYNVNYDYTVTYVKGRVRKDKFHVFNDNRKDEEFSGFIKNVFDNIFEFSQDYAPFYCWHASKTGKLFQQGIEDAGGHISLTIFWLKDNCTFSKGLDYLWTIEPCFYGWKKGNTHFVNKDLKLQMKNIENLGFDDFELMPNIWYEKRDKISEYGHPTQKPLRLAERAIKKSSLKDQIVLDLFGGSGSTLMACEQMQRKAYLMELDPKYCEVIIKRWELYTGKKAEKVV